MSRMQVTHIETGPTGKASCTCRACSNDPLLITGIRRCRFALETGRIAPDDERNEPLLGPLDASTAGGAECWRWRCTCQSRTGEWQAQSPGVAFHAWRRHAGLEHPNGDAVAQGGRRGGRG